MFLVWFLGALKKLSRWSAGVRWLISDDVVKCWSLVVLCAFLVGHPLRGRFASTRPLRFTKGRLFRSIAASLFGFARAITGYSFLIQNTASPMSPDHRSSGRLLVGAPFGVSQFLSIVVL